MSTDLHNVSMKVKYLVDFTVVNNKTSSNIYNVDKASDDQKLVFERLQPSLNKFFKEKLKATGLKDVTARVSVSYHETKNGLNISFRLI